VKPLSLGCAPVLLVLGLAGLGLASACGGDLRKELKIPFSNDELAARARDSDRVQAGRRAFRIHCTACHGPTGGGASQFPSLVDDAWVHGNAPRDIYRSIAAGSRAKGMQSFAHLGEEAVADLAAYVIYLNQ